MTPAIFGLSGAQLTDGERAFFAAANPAGYILFARNIVDGDQVRRLTDALRDLHGRDDALIMIDQEGGNVARLRPPHWPEFPAAGVFDRLYDVAPATAIAALEANAEAIGGTLRALGIGVNAWPLLDVQRPDAHPSIASRSFGADAMRVAALGRAALGGLAKAGVAGVIKHMPGQGRATSDSHFALPVVDAPASALEQDLAPFRALAAAPMGMTAHVIYSAWDAGHCATMSRAVIDNIIRGAIGFDGLLMTDGLEMEALSGPMADRARAALDAGVDVALHCTGDLADMTAIADAVGQRMNSRSLLRLEHAMQHVSPAGGDAQRVADALARRDALLAVAAG